MTTAYEGRECRGDGIVSRHGTGVRADDEARLPVHQRHCGTDGGDEPSAREPKSSGDGERDRNDSEVVAPQILQLHYGLQSLE